MLEAKIGFPEMSRVEPVACRLVGDADCKERLRLLIDKPKSETEVPRLAEVFDC